MQRMLIRIIITKVFLFIAMIVMNKKISEMLVKTEAQATQK